METIDSQILHELQYDFPMSERPYEVIAERLKISKKEIWNRVQTMLEEGVIRRMGASFDSNKLGFPSTLAAVSVAPEQVDHAAEVIGQFYEVTHSYLRNDAFNIWFTLIAADNNRIESILEQIRKSLNLNKSKVLNLPMKRLFKLDARFRVRK
jgi:DNA-binding Lrp family transcriptional regulator